MSANASAGGAMQRLAGGTFRMGSVAGYAEERPAHYVSVDAFCIDVTPVTNSEFAAFIAATGYRSWAERVPDGADYPGADPALLVPASAVFMPPPHPVDTRDHAQWWRLVPGADWRHPYGPASDLAGLDGHPVVHIAHADAAAYAAWAGKRLPSEAEWEFAARGGLADAHYAWATNPRLAGSGSPITGTACSRMSGATTMVSRAPRRSAFIPQMATGCTT
jgi:sulfatase modifying factor 1